jgi:hypothetical protein
MWNIQRSRLGILLRKFFRLDEQGQLYIEDFTRQLTETQEIPYELTDSNELRMRFKEKFENDLLKVLETNSV